MKNIKLDQILSIDTKKTTKINAFNTLLNFVDDAEHLEQYELKELYSALKTIYPATKASAVSDYWKLLVKCAAKKDVRYYLNGIHVKDENTLVSSSGHVLCQVDLKENHSLTIGSLYEAQNEKIVSNALDCCKYPDFDKIFNGTRIDITDNFNIDAIHNGYDKIEGGAEYNKIEEHYYLNKYLKLIPKNYSNVYLYSDINIKELLNVLVVELETDKALIKLVIMSARI